MKMASTQLSAWCSMASERRSSVAYGWEWERAPGDAGRVDLRQGGGGGGLCEGGEGLRVQWLWLWLLSMAEGVRAVGVCPRGRGSFCLFYGLLVLWPRLGSRCR